MNPLIQFKKIPILPLLIALALVADLNNNVFVSGAYGPTLPAGWTLAEIFEGSDCAGCWDD